MNASAIQSQIRSLEAQLEVLKSRVIEMEQPRKNRKFAELYGVLKGKSSTTEAELDEAEYRVKWDGSDV